MMRIKTYIPGSLLLLATLAATPMQADDYISCKEYYTHSETSVRGGTIEAAQDGNTWILTATPANSKWMFVQWSDGNTDNPRTIVDTLMSDLTETFTAEFAVWVYTNCYAPNEFTMDPEYAIVEDTSRIEVTQPVTDGPYYLEAIAEDGFTFAQWADGSYENPRRFTPSTSTKDTIYATFIPTRKIGKIDFWRKDGFVVTTTETEGELDDPDQYSNITVYYNGQPVSCGQPDNGTDYATELRVDVGVYFLPASYGSDHSLAGTSCHIVYRNEDTIPVATLDTVIPYLIDTEETLSIADAGVGVHVLDNGVATFATDQEIADLDIYPGGKVVISADLTVSSVKMRADAMTAYQSGEKDYPFPHPELFVTSTGTLTNGNNDTIYYDYLTDPLADAWYPFALPYASNTAWARYNSGEDATDNFLIDKFSTALRGTGASGWTPYYDTEGGYYGGAIEPGVGYDIYAVHASRNEDMTYGAVLRFPMVADLSSGIENKQINVSMAGTEDTYKNWNLISIPYLCAYQRGTIGMYKGDEYIDKDIRYVTYPDLNWEDFNCEEITASTVLYPFHPYYVQFADTIDNLRILAPTVAAAPARHRAKAAAVAEDISAGITVSHAHRVDHIGLHIGDNYTTGYDVNADMAKIIGNGPRIKLYSISNSKKLAYIALPPAEGTGSVETIIPLGYDSAKVGQEMTFAYDEKRYPELSERGDVAELNLIDNVEGTTTNLLEDSYTCTANAASDNTRFSLGIRYTYKAPQIATDICGTPAETTMRDGIYDLLGRLISTDARAARAGVYIVIENGKARKEVVR